MTRKFHNSRQYWLVCFSLLAVVLATVSLQPTVVQGEDAPAITVCANGCDFTTLQAAIDNFNVSPGSVISIVDPIHTEAGILITKNVAIQGQGAERTIVQAHAVAGEARDRVFFIKPGVSVTLRDMTIRHGNPRVLPESGGGIYNEGSLQMENVIVSQNSGGAGGGILSDGTLKMVNCIVRDNEARGGADTYAECDTGGGIKGMHGEITLINSAVYSNQAKGKGGGIHVACEGTLKLINSTISKNRTRIDGGGVFLNGIGEFTNSTISENTASSGGGIYIKGTREKGVIRGQFSYTQTLIANNSVVDTQYGFPDCLVGDYATIKASTYNLVGDGHCEPALSGDPLLEPLSGENAPAIYALLPESPAIDAVPADQCATQRDQLGTPRPQGKGCDIGAFELPQEGGLTAQSKAFILAGAVFVLAVVAAGLLLQRKRTKSIAKAQ